MFLSFCDEYVVVKREPSPPYLLDPISVMGYRRTENTVNWSMNYILQLLVYVSIRTHLVSIFILNNAKLFHSAKVNPLSIWLQ